MKWAPEVTVVIDSSLDWIGSVLVPVAAILVSSGIAIYLASRERRASDRSHTREQVAAVIRTLTEFAAAAQLKDWDALNRTQIEYMTNLNVLAAYLPRRDYDVARYCAGVMAGPYDAHDRNGIIAASTWLAACLESWVRGDLRGSQFKANVPPETDEIWSSEPPALGDWRQAIKSPN
ncbi:hypothetical protein [Microbacterium sp.]|uniref:hypothetical protein n=1 Tax=Microbacterium sp. TaxID=51671 RepID=UPI003F6F7DC7